MDKLMSEFGSYGSGNGFDAVQALMAELRPHEILVSAAPRAC